MKTPVELFDLSGKTVLITGGSRGLGRAMALCFSRAGARVAIASRKLESCKAAAAEIEAQGGEAFPYACHVGHWQELDALVEAVYERFGRLDVLVNNAGLSPLVSSSLETSEDLYDKILAVNLKGPFRLTALVGSRMAAGQGGSIINISSGAAVRPTPSTAPYSAAKAGLNALTVAYAKEFAPTVRVNCIMAGPFHTDISKAWSRSEAFTAEAKTRIALQRAGEPEEIVGAALYLASEASSYTTGSILPVDGGSS